jgi:hypothetical protein
MKKYGLMFISLGLFLGFGLFSGMIFANGVKSLTLKPLPIASVAKIYESKLFSITAALTPGSLKANIERVAKENGWHTVVWNARDDFNWVAYAKIRKQNLVAIMESILDGYPLQAVFYQGNRVLVIEARTMR